MLSNLKSLMHTTKKLKSTFLNGSSSESFSRPAVATTSHIFAVMKKDGNVRLVQDFRAHNNESYTDKYSMKDVSECIREIGRSGSTIFSTIDLTAGFW